MCESLGSRDSTIAKRSVHRRTAAAFVVAAAAAGCGQDVGDPTYGSSSAPFVVFRRAEMYVDKLEVPVVPQVVVGSTFAPSTVVSDSPGIISIRGDGSLVAHKEGTAVIRSRTNPTQVLTVHVRLPRSLELDPPKLELEHGDEVQLRLLAAGSAIPARHVQWLSSKASVALVREGRIEARGAGTASITAQYGGERASATVVVGEVTADPTLVIRPARIRARVGEAVVVEVERRGLPIVAVWSANPSGVLRAAGSTSFVAVRTGTGELCAEVTGQRRCVAFTVR